MDRLRFTDLEIGKVYKSCTGYLYKIIETHYNDELDLLVRNCEGNEWVQTCLKVSRILEMKFTEVPKEIDWTKIPKWTKVLVKDKDEREYKNAYFMGIDSENGETQFGVTFYDMFIFADRCGECEFEYFDCCKLHPLEKAKEDWYKYA